MNSSTMVSIITVVQNSERYVKDTIDSVLRQTHEAWELIVVDNGSTDSSLNIANSYADADNRIHVIPMEKSSPSRCKNFGLKNSSESSVYVCFLNTEDLLEPRAIDHLVSLADINNLATGANGNARFIDSSGRPAKMGDSEITDRLRLTVSNGKITTVESNRPTTFECFVVRNYIPFSGAAILRKSVVVEMEGFDERLAPCDDWYLYTQMCRRGPIRFLDETVLQHRLGALTHESDPRVIRNSEILMRRKIALSKNNTTDQAIVAETVFRQWQRYYIKKKLQNARKAITAGKVIVAAKNLGYTVKPIVSLMKGRP